MLYLRFILFFYHLPHEVEYEWVSCRRPHHRSVDRLAVLSDEERTADLVLCVGNARPLAREERMLVCLH